MNIFVSNLSFKASDEDLFRCFERYGAVESARIIKDRDTQRSKGYGFVEMPNDDEGKAAIEGLNGYNFMDREMVVNESKPREQNSRPSGRGGGRSNYGGGGGGRRDY